MTTPYHQPEPGSRYHAAHNAAWSEQPDMGHVQVKQDELDAQQSEMRPVPVDVVRAEQGVYRTTVLNASAARQILPQDATRRLAAIMSIDTDIVLCGTKDLATDAANQVASVPYPTGFYLPKSTLIYVTNRALLWAANTSTSTVTRVSVIVEKDETPNSFLDE